MATSRRKFLGAVAVGVGAGVLGSIGASRINWRRLVPKTKRAGDIRLAVIGTGGHGRKLINRFSKLPDCHISTVCDADDRLLRRGADAVTNLTGHKPQSIKDMRRIFERQDIDAVVIATPNHWHALAAIWAMQSGKDVYLEKPVSHSLLEGEALIRVATEEGRIVQSGLQRRANSSLKAAVDYIEAGSLGTVNKAHCMSYKRRHAIGPSGNHAPPDDVDYDLWCGPAAKVPITRSRFHYDWHWFWNYGDGGLGNNGVHRIDAARWGLGVTGYGDAVFSYGGRFGPSDAGETPNSQVTVHRFGDKILIHELRGLETNPHPLFNIGDGIIFYGSQGIITFGRGRARLLDLSGAFIRDFEDVPGPSHHANFLKAVQSRKHEDLYCNVTEGHFSSALCHFGAISHRLGKEVADEDILKAAMGLNFDDDISVLLPKTRAYLANNDLTNRFVLGRPLELGLGGENISTDPDVMRLAQMKGRASYRYSG